MVAASWIFTVVVALVVAALVLYIAGAKTAEVRQANDTLLDALADLVNALEQQPIPLSDYVTDKIEVGRDVVELYDDCLVTRDTLPR